MTQTPPPHNQHAPFGATPSPATVDRLINLNKDDSDDDYDRRNHNNRSGAAASSSSATTSAAVRKRSTRTRANSAKSNASNHSNKSNRSGVSVVYAVDANIRIPSSPIVHSPKQNSSNIQESADGKIGAEAASSANGTQKTKPKKKIKVRNAETQTKLSYCGDYEHGRPVLIHHREDPDVYVGKTVATLLMLGIVFDIVVGTVSYYINWRVREPLLLEFKYQRILQTLYPAALVSGTAIGFGVVIPVLSWVVSGYLESKKHDKYFLFAQILWSVFSGIPMVMVEALWVGPVTKDEVIYYPPYSLLLSQFALVIHCIVAGASLWYFYLIFCSRKLNDAVQGRRELWIQYQRGIIGSRKCEASRIAIRTAEEIEAKQQGSEMFSINDLIASRMAATRDGGARSYEFLAIADEIHQSEDNKKNQQRVGGGITNNNNNSPAKAGDGFSASPLPTVVPQPNKDQTEFSIGGKKFSAVTSAAAGNEAAAELGDENAWGSPFKEEVAVFRSGKHKKRKGKNGNDDDDDGDTSDNGADKNNHNDENRPSASAVDVPPTPAPNNSSNKNNKHNKGDRNSPHVNWRDGDEQDDDAEEFARRRSSVARNVLDDDDPFRS